MDRQKLLQMAVIGLVGVITGGVGADILPGAPEPSRAVPCAVDEAWKATVEARLAQLSTVPRDVREIREILAELRGRGAFGGDE